jgi:hypothetical protein
MGCFVEPGAGLVEVYGMLAHIPQARWLVGSSWSCWAEAAFSVTCGLLTV